MTDDHDDSAVDASDTPTGVAAENRDIDELFGINLEWSRWWAILPEIVVVACTAALPVLIGLGVVSRYTDWFRVPWVQDVVGVLFMWVVFLGGAVAVKHGAHVSMTSVADRIATRGRLGRVWGVIVELSPIGMGAILLIVGLLVVDIHMTRELAWLQIPFGYFSTIIPFSGALMIFYATTRWRSRSRGDVSDDPNHSTES